MISAKDVIRFTLIHALIFDHIKAIFSLKVSENVSLLLFFVFILLVVVLVCYTAVFSVVTQRSSPPCVADCGGTS